MISSDAFYSTKKDGYHEDEHGHESNTGHTQETRKRENSKIILKNIMDVKHKKKLSLSQRNEKCNLKTGKIS